MSKAHLNKIKFNDSREPIEIFCHQKYKDYYLRGQIIEISDNIYDKTLPDEYGYAYYHFKIFALINDNYIKRSNIEAEDAYYSALGIFSGRTKAEFIKIQKENEFYSAKELAGSFKTTPEKLLKDSLSRKNTPLEINLKEIDLQETPYLLNSIRNKKDIIIVKMDICLNRVEPSKDNAIIPNYIKRIYQLPSYHLAPDSEYSEADMSLFEDLFNILYFNFDYNFTDKNEYYRLLIDMAEIGYDWIKKQKVSKDYIARLNKLNSSIKDRTLPFYDFCYNFFDDLLDELKDKQKITQCSFCGNIFTFHRTRKYCSLETEGKNCGKSARNQRFYSRHREEILPKARKYSAEYRKYKP